ncbi:piggyBac transposable element-derived protein 4-like [Anomaloglossus baeobatrachus]
MKMSRRSFSAEEAYAFLASDTESASEDDTPVILSSSSSSGEEEPPEPPRRHRYTTRKAAPETSDPAWTSPPDSYQPVIPEFTASSGIMFGAARLRKIDFFKIYFTDGFVKLMVTQTNLYAQQFLARNPTSVYAQPHRWTPVTVAEMMRFWGLLLKMGLWKKPSIRDYWSADFLYHTFIFHAAMPRTRFEAILRFLHYNDSAQSKPREDPGFDCFYKIRPLIQHFSFKFAQAYTPERRLSIGESLVHFKRGLHFCQSLQRKRVRYGIKMHKLCESTSGYVCNFRIYSGKGCRVEAPGCPNFLGTGGKIVWDLVYPLLDRGYHLYLDHFYTSVPLLKCLASKGTAACGIVRVKEKGLSAGLLGQRLEKGESRALCSGNVLCVRYKDKREVHVLSTLHGLSSTPDTVHGTGAKTGAPACAQECTKYMRGVDLSDQMLEPYSAARQMRLWYKKLALHIVQMALYNAYVLSRRAGHRGTFPEFQEAVIRHLLLGVPEEQAPTTSSFAMESTRTVLGQHFPGKVPQTGKVGSSQKRCRVCSKNGIRKDTSYQCDSCPVKPGLCMKNCFRIYHTSPIFGDKKKPGTSSASEDSRVVPGQHFPSEVPNTGKKGRSQKRCRVCFKRGIRRETIYQCGTCPVKPGLCMKDCFRIYHTSL